MRVEGKHWVDHITVYLAPLYFGNIEFQAVCTIGCFVSFRLSAFTQSIACRAEGRGSNGSISPPSSPIDGTRLQTQERVATRRRLINFTCFDFKLRVRASCVGRARFDNWKNGTMSLFTTADLMQSFENAAYPKCNAWNWALTYFSLGSLLIASFMGSSFTIDSAGRPALAVSTYAV